MGARARRQPGSWADVALAGFTIGAVALLLVPLPTPLLDVLLAGNLAASLVLLLVALRVDTPLRVAAFPTWVVLNTLLRLALNVSSTRLILAQADAGRVIRAYGDLVAGSSAIIGGVLFALLSIVQFVVIARGAERVAEVGARFVLDGLPGKQMAIDAELRAGTLDARGAEARRARLDQEGQFFGAMDGAMKFVRGDVIASLLVIAVNFIGGFGVGMAEHGLDALTALHRYGLLTIGDGLAAAVPSLLVATAAGVLVTRVAGETRAGIGAELVHQLLRQPQVLRWVSVACLLVAVAPGMPAWPFVAAGAACALVSLLRPGVPSAQEEDGALAFAVAPDRATWLARGPMPRLRLGPAPLERVARGLVETTLRPLGLPPAVLEQRPTFRVDERLPDGAVELLLRGTPVHRAALHGPPANEPGVERLVAELSPPLIQHAAELLGLEEVQQWLDELAVQAPVTVREAVPGRIPLATFTEVLRLLLREQVPLTGIRAILSALARPATPLPEETTPGALLPLARHASRAALSRALAGSTSRLRCLRFDALIEDTIREARRFASRSDTVALAPAATRDILRALRHTLHTAASAGQRPPATPPHGTTSPTTPPVVLLAPAELRPHVRGLIAEEFPLLPVVSAAELLPQLELELVGTIRLLPPAAPQRGSLDPESRGVPTALEPSATPA